MVQHNCMQNLFVVTAGKFDGIRMHRHAQVNNEIDLFFMFLYFIQ